MFKLEFGSRQLFEGGREVHLQEQPMRLLMLLLDRPGDLHTREELRKQLWPDDTFVEFDDGLNTAIQKIRQVLGDEARNPRFVETVPRQGYRFIAPVHFEANGVITAPPLEVTYPAQPEPVPELPASPRRIDWRWAALTALLGFGAAWFLPRAPQATASRALRLSIPPPPGVELRAGIRGGSAISRDGSAIVFAGTRDGKHLLWVRQLNSLDARPLAGTEDAILPFWSPDGKSIGFQSAGKIRRIDLAGGPPIEVATATRPTRGGWTDDGFILFATGTGGPIQRVKASGGPASAASIAGALWPHPVAGSGRFLYFNNTVRRIELATVSGSAQPASLFAADAAAIYAPAYHEHPGHLLWLKGTALMAQPFDATRATLTGDAVAVAEGVGFADRSRYADVSVSENGVLLYGPGNTIPSRLVWMRRDGSIAEYVGETDWLRSLRLSPDGKRALIERGLPQALWIFDFERTLFTRVTFEPAWSGWPVWSPDGAEIAYSGERDARVGIYTRNAKAGRPESKLAGSSFDDFLYDWSRDGQRLIYCEVNPHTKLDLWILPLTGDRTPRPFLTKGYNEDWPQFSPDGRWVVYVSDESGRNEVYVTTFPKADAKWQISIDGGTMPRWAANNEIFFESATGNIMAVQTRPGGWQFEWSPPRRLFPNPTPGRGYDVSPRGDRFLMMAPADGRNRNELTVVVDWQAALRR